MSSERFAFAPVKNVRKGDRLRASDETKDVKTVARIEKARAAGYLIAVFEDGTQRALGHRSGLIGVYPPDSGAHEGSDR